MMRSPDPDSHGGRTCCSKSHPSSFVKFVKFARPRRDASDAYRRMTAMVDPAGWQALGARVAALAAMPNMGPMAWTVETLNEFVDGELRALRADMRARFARTCESIAAIGLERMGAPHVRHLFGPLCEMRLSGRDGISTARVHEHTRDGQLPPCPPAEVNAQNLGTCVRTIGPSVPWRGGSGRARPATVAWRRTRPRPSRCRVRCSVDAWRAPDTPR